MDSDRKGKDGEREAAKVLGDLLGIDCRRGQQHTGIEGRDVVGLPGVHLEVKRVERLHLYQALQQAQRDTTSGDVPLVLHRANGKPWVAIVPLADLPRLAEQIYLTKAATV